MEEVANPIAKASFDRVEPAVEKMYRRLGFRLRQARRRAIARHGVISAGVPTPESLVGPSWRLRRLQFPTTPATAPPNAPAHSIRSNRFRDGVSWVSLGRSISVMTAAVYRRFLEKRATECLGFTGPDRIRPLRSLAMMTNLIGAASFATIDKGPESHLGPPGHLAAPPVEWLRYLVLVHRAAALLHACLRPVSRRRHCVSPILHRHQTG